jgi:hypothetical protein
MPPPGVRRQVVLDAGLAASAPDRYRRLAFFLARIAAGAKVCDLQRPERAFLRSRRCPVRHSCALTILAFVISASTAFGQESGLGAGRYEIGALPGGATFFTKSGDEAEPDFGNYLVGGAFTYNVNRWVGIEGEAGTLVGIKQNMMFSGQALTKQHTPNMLGYTGNVVFNPLGSDRSMVPFVTGGMGGLTMFDTKNVANLGITSNTTFLTGNVGGGLRWFPARHWGARGDYRLMMVDGKDTAPAFFGRESIRYGHRISAGLVLTY